MKLRATSVIGLLVALCLTACNKPLSVDLVVENVAILDIRSGEYIENHVLVAHDGVIQHVGPESTAADFLAKQTIDGAGGYLIPALGDAHVHLQSYSELESYLRYGVTAVFNMSGRPKHLRMKASTASGDTLGPRIVTVGPTLDGPQPTNPLFVSVTPELADDIVEWTHAQGYDAVKVYQQIQRDALAAVVSSASARGMITTGHVSRFAGIQGSLSAGLRHIAHGEELAFPHYVQVDGRYAQSALPELARTVREADATVTPMVSYLENIPPQATALSSYLGREPMKLVPAVTKQSWDYRQSYYANRDNPEAFAAQVGELARFVSTMTKQLHDEGVLLILGTDASFGGAIPGYSVHQELQSLVRSGLTPLEALQTATLNVGIYLGSAAALHAPWGEIKEGFAADLLLLKRDPLTEISATLNIQGVAKGGVWLGERALATIESNLREEQRLLTDAVRAAETYIVDGNPDALRELTVEHLEADHIDPLIGPDNCIFLGYRHYYGGQRTLAGEIYEVCALMSPTHAPLWIHIALAREASGDTERAIEAYQTAESLNPWYGNPRQAIERLRLQK